MAIPVLINQNAFDSTAIHTFGFTWSGNQSYANRLRIYKNNDNSLVYDQIQTTFKLEHNLPANTLTNGILYSAEISSIDQSGTQSSFSTKILFYCYTVPTFVFSNIVANQVIGSASIECLLIYSQLQGELLNNYKVTLYNLSKIELSNSGVKYNTNTLSGRIYNLIDNTQYYLRATGTTVNGMSLDTGYILVSVNYESPSQYALVQLENISAQASVKLTSNIKVAFGVSNPDPAIYIDNSKVDLKSTGSYVNFNSGFSIADNFIMGLVGINLTPYSTCCVLSNTVGTGTITLKAIKGTFTVGGTEQFYIRLIATSGIVNYILTSNLINVPSSTDRVFIWIKKQDNLYSLKIENLGA